MIELFAVSFATRQLILVLLCIALGLSVIGVGIISFLKIKALRAEHSVESLPTLVDLGLEKEDDEGDSYSSDEEVEYAFFTDEEDEDILTGDFLDKSS